jgi:exoribonuclease-2
MPGGKVTMLPDDVVQAFTLTEGRDCPAVSLYVTLDEATLEIRQHETRIECVPIVANLRHDRLDAIVTEATLTGQSPADHPFPAELSFAFRLARHLKAQREQVRGKPETFNRPDYTFALEREAGADGLPTGQETVTIRTRQRGAPLDLIVAEAMILANSHWGGWIARLGVPGIYRSQASLLPGVKVRMGTKPLPHAGMGVAQYTWATSPLRRYVDLVNQWQIIACARHGATAALAAPFKPRDATLFSIISGFDGAYSAYNDFQNGIERFWTLRWIEQNGVSELEASVMKDGLVRADTLPLVLRATGTESLPRGTRVRVRLSGCDLLTLDAWGALLARLEGPGEAAAESLAPEAEEDDAVEASGPLALAIDVGDASNDTSLDTPSEGASTPGPGA